MDAAWELFGEKGCDETSVEDIAERAEVSPATIYNYFGSKSELLQSLFSRFIEQEAEEGESILNSPPKDIASGMTALYEKYLDGMARRCTPQLRCELYALSVSRQFAYGRQSYDLKRRFFDQGLRLATYYKQRGQVRNDVSAEEIAVLCYSASVYPLALFSLGLGIDVDTARRMLHRYMALTLTGITDQ